MSETLFPETAWATISPCQKYRYALGRCWDHAGKRVVFAMLNPSVADATADDPTIRRCIRFARKWGYGSLEVVNLFAWRATDPKELRIAADPIGLDNDAEIVQAANGRVVCAALSF